MSEITRGATCADVNCAGARKEAAALRPDAAGTTRTGDGVTPGSGVSNQIVNDTRELSSQLVRELLWFGQEF
jgi:hypothetical protein